MNVIINGKASVIEEQVTVKELLDKDYTSTQEYVTVQVNEKIIKKKDYDTYLIKEGDTVEFLYYMGGGS